MKKDKDWQKSASTLLKAELARRDLSYEDLSRALKNIGIEKTANSLNVAINRGTFSFAFFLQCAEAVGLEKLYLA